MTTLVRAESAPGQRATLSRRSSWSAPPLERHVLIPSPRPGNGLKPPGLYSQPRATKRLSSRTTRLLVRLILLAVACYILFRKAPRDTQDLLKSKLDKFRQKSKAESATKHKADVIYVPGAGRHTATVILMHGLGSSAEITLPPVKRIHRRLFQVSWQIPNSGSMAIKAFKGAVKNAWFDMSSIDNEEGAPLPKNEDENNMKLAVDKVHGLVEAELAKGVDPKRVVLAGFSQGCAIALLAGLSTQRDLAGMMCLSGWLPLSDQLHKDVNGTMHPMQTSHANKMPIFWGHGTADPIIRYGWGEQSRELLKQMGFTKIESHAYPGMGHWVGPDEEEDMRHWLAQVLPQL
ncbi:hypothetical protein OIO90_005886 [Microbotryomycetes sp. JL221]|nr:hypothetical protein OIO90_005886 [Microbotryomycetes sp. JL221]